MRRRKSDGRAPFGAESIYADVSAAVEREFGAGSLDVDEGARAAFVRASLLLAVKARVEPLGAGPGEAWLQRSRAERDVRRELAAVLGVDEDEVFRLRHRAAGLRAGDGRYRATMRAIERDVAGARGMVV